MPCVVCQSAESKYRCIDCADELCREHVYQCVGCGKPLCHDHLQRTPGGRTLCNMCMAARNERHRERRLQREAAAPPVAPATSPAPSSGGGFSFQDLMSDLPPAPAAPSGGTGFQDLHDGPPAAAPQAAAGPRDFDDPRDDRYLGADGLDDVPDPDIDRRLAQMLGEDEKAVRVLAGSAPKGKPMWISGAFLGAMTWGVCIFIALNSAFDSFEPLGSYVVMVLALGTLAWSISGLRNENDEPQARKLNLIGLFLALSAALVAFLQRNSGAN
jgi:hypothetical protein